MRNWEEKTGTTQESTARVATGKIRGRGNVVGSYAEEKQKWKYWWEVNEKASRKAEAVEDLMREQIGWQKPTEMPRVIEAMDNCGKLTGGFPSAKKLYPSLAPLVSSDCLCFPKSACPVFLRALLKFLPLHICCCCPREFCQAFQVSIWCCSLLPKHCLGKTMFMHTI